MTMRRTPGARRAIKLGQVAVLVALFVLLWQTVDGREAARILLSAELGWIAASAAFLTVQTILSALRWRLTAHQLGFEIEPARAVREYYLAQLVNLSLPGGLIGDAGRAFRARERPGLVVAGQSVIFERLAGQLGLFAVFLGGFGLTLGMPGPLQWPAWLIWPVAIGLGACAATPLVIAALVRALGRDGHPLRRFVDRFVHAIAARNVRARQIAFSLATAGCNLMAFVCCALALGVALPPIATATLVPLILFSMLLPLTIGGWGVREGAAALLFPLMGATASEGLATSVAFGLVFTASVLPGLVVSWVAARDRNMAPAGGTAAALESCAPGPHGRPG